MEDARKTPNPVDVAVGARVRLRRMERGMSQETLGDEIGITFRQVQKYEKGTNRISASRLKAIALTLDVPVAWFFAEAEPGSPVDRLDFAIAREAQTLTDEGKRSVLQVIAALRGTPADKSYTAPRAA